MTASEPSNARASARAVIARALFLLALAALALGVFVEAGGGFRLEAPGPRISVRGGFPSLSVAALAFAGALALCRRDALRQAWQATLLATRHAWAVAALMALVVAFTGVRLGSAAAAGADASGYISQAALWRSGAVRTRVPLLLRHPWPNAAWTLSPLGYRPGPLPDDIVPTYPPGLPLQFAAVTALAGDEEALAYVVPLLGALAVWLVFSIGQTMGGGPAGLAAAALLATSPTFLQHLVQPMSDVPATAWWLVAVALALRGSGSWALLSGIAAGIAVLIRPNLAPLLVVVSFMLWPRGRERRPRREWLARIGMLCAGVVPAACFLGWHNATLYGAPWRSGYGDAAELFARANVWPNLRNYSSWLAETHLPLLALALLGATIAFVRPAGPRLRGGAAALTAFAALNVACYLPYGVFENATYVRFLLPAIAALTVLAGLGLAAVRVRVSANPDVGGAGSLVVRTVAGVALVAFVAGLGVGHARSEGAFETRRREARYALVADWVRAHTSPDDLVLAAQHSGSISHTAKRRVVRWDLLDPGHDDVESKRRPPCTHPARPPALVATTWLEHVASYGVSSLVVVEADEEEAFRARFGPASPCGLLDWPPYAATDPPSVVRVYRLGDRARYLAGESWIPQRIARTAD